MKKPVEAIQQLRRICMHDDLDSSGRKVLAYLDSIKEWPADLTRERLGELAKHLELYTTHISAAVALRRISLLAPSGKRKVNLWAYKSFSGARIDVFGRSPDWVPIGNDSLMRWRKVGEAEIDA